MKIVFVLDGLTPPKKSASQKRALIRSYNLRKLNYVLAQLKNKNLLPQQRLDLKARAKKFKRASLKPTLAMTTALKKLCSKLCLEMDDPTLITFKQAPDEADIVLRQFEANNEIGMIYTIESDLFALG